MLRDSRQTLSADRVRVCVSARARAWNPDARQSGRTDVVRLVEDDDGVFGDVLGHLLGDLWVEEVVEGVDHDVDERHLRRRAMQ